MNKEFIPYEQALELKELGFNEECFAYYYTDIDENILEKGYDTRKKLEINGYSESFDDENTFVINKNEVNYYATAPLYQQAFRWLRNQYITKRYINERGDYIEGNFFNLPLIFPNGYEIKLLKPSTSYTIVGGREIPFYAEPEAVYKETTESYESAELACLKKLIEILKNK